MGVTSGEGEGVFSLTGATCVVAAVSCDLRELSAMSEKNTHRKNLDKEIIIIKCYAWQLRYFILKYYQTPSNSINAR